MPRNQTKCSSDSRTDATAHMTEEMKDARKDAPKAIIWAVWIGAITGFIFLVAVCFCIVNIDDAASSPTGVPIFRRYLGDHPVSFGLICHIVMRPCYPRDSLLIKKLLTLPLSRDFRVCHKVICRRNSALCSDFDHLSSQFGFPLCSELSVGICFRSRRRAAILQIL